MPMATISSRDLARNVRRAMHMATTEPIFVTERGKPAYVFLSIEQLSRLKGTPSESLPEIADSTSSFPNQK